MVFMSSPHDELPEPPWSSVPHRRRRRALSREAITEAALALVDAHGLDALSMRNVAERLGVQASALYGHVSGKQELIQLMLDRVALEIELPEPDPTRWEEQVKEFARASRRALGAHRDLAGASLANIPTGPSMLGLIDRLLALLSASGLPRQAVAYAADLLPQFVTASVYEESLFIQRLEREPRYFEQIEAYFRAAPAARFPALADLVTELTGPEEGPDARFEFGLDVIVQGLAAIASQAATSRPPASRRRRAKGA
jgi:AcrR family transcriptional regulator